MKPLAFPIAVFIPDDGSTLYLLNTTEDLTWDTRYCIYDPVIEPLERPAKTQDEISITERIVVWSSIVPADAVPVIPSVPPAVAAYALPGEQSIALEPPLVEDAAVYRVYYFTTGGYTAADSSFFFRASPTFFDENGITGLLVTRDDVVVDDEEVMRRVFILYTAAHQLYRAVKVDELGSVPPDFNNDLRAVIRNPVFIAFQLAALLKNREAQTSEALRGILTNQSGRDVAMQEWTDTLKTRLEQGSSLTDAVDWTLEAAQFSNNKTVREVAREMGKIFTQWQPVTEQGTSYVDLGSGVRVEFANALDLLSLGIQLVWMAQLQQERAEWLALYQNTFPRNVGALDAVQRSAANTVLAETEDAWLQRANIILGFARDRLAGGVLFRGSQALAEAWADWSWQEFGKRTTGHLVGGVVSAVFLGGTLGNLLYGVDDLYDNFRKAERANELRLRFNRGRRALERTVPTQPWDSYGATLAAQYRAAYMLESLAAAQTLRSYADGVEATYRLPNPVVLFNWLRGEDWEEAVAGLRDLANQTELAAEETVGHPVFVDAAINLAMAQLSGRENKPEQNAFPTEREIAYVKDGSIWLRDLASGQDSLVIEDGSITSLAWSPDGDWLVFASDKTGDSNIYLLPTYLLEYPASQRNSQIIDLTYGPSHEFGPTFSQREPYLLFWISSQGGRESQIVRHDLSSGSEYVVYESGVYDPCGITTLSVASDADMAVSMYCGTGGGNAEGVSLLEFGPRGPREVFLNNVLNDNWHLSDSPERRQICPVESYRIYSAKWANTKPALAFIESPDCFDIVFGDTHDGMEVIAIIDYALSTPGSVAVYQAQNISNVEWSPDDMYLAFGVWDNADDSHSPKEDIWILDRVKGTAQRIVENASSPAWRPFSASPQSLPSHLDSSLEQPPAPTLELMRPIQNITALASVHATSILPSDQCCVYTPDRAVDGSFATAWVEGKQDAGIGEAISLFFPDTVTIDHLMLDIGYDSQEDIFYNNNRIKTATIIFSDGSRIQHTFADIRGLQTVSVADILGKAAETTFIQIVIEDVYRGSKYNDTSLAEVEIWGRP